MFTIFTAALNAVIYRYTGQDDIPIGFLIAERDRMELQPLIGFLMDIHVLRTDVSGDPTFQDLLARVRQGLVDVYSHRAVPFNQVVAALQPKRSPSYNPLFQVLLIWRDRDARPQFIGLPGLTIHPILSQCMTSKFDLTLNFTETGDSIGLEIEYSTDLFDEARIERMVGHLSMLLEGAVINSVQRVGSMPLLTKVEREMLMEWNDEAAE